MSNTLYNIQAEAEPLPKLEDDLHIVSKLPDTPREENGFPTQKFKETFDLAGLAVQKYVNDVLIPALIAGRIPFRSTSDIPKTNVQEAIESVQKQIVDVIAGTIPNGSVGFEKLSEEAVKRMWGGVPWISLDAPTADDGLAKGYPIGQEWVTPRFELTNLAKNPWTVLNGKAETGTNTVTFTGDKSLATLSATMNVSDAGEAEDRCFLLFDLGDTDPEITEITVSIGGQAPQTVNPGRNVIETDLITSAAAINFSATWPTASVADGSIVIDNLTFVDVTTVLSQLPGVIDKRNWGAYLDGVIPFDTYISRFSGWVHVTDGKWSQEVFEVLPTNRGGTGIGSYAPGQILYANKDGTLSALNRPAEESYLVNTPSGEPRWSPVSALGTVQTISGDYQGNGQERTIELPETPKMVFISSVTGSYKEGSNRMHDTATAIVQGCKSGELFAVSGSSGGTRDVIYSAEVKDNTIVLDGKYMNGIGRSYKWVALI